MEIKIGDVFLRFHKGEPPSAIKITDVNTEKKCYYFRFANQYMPTAYLLWNEFEERDVVLVKTQLAELLYG